MMHAMETVKRVPRWRRAGRGLVALLLVLSGTVAAQTLPPPGWVGVVAGGGMALREGSGAHLGGGLMVVPAVLVADYEPGWRVDLFQIGRAGEGPRRGQALFRLRRADGVALLALRDAAGWTVARACPADEPGPATGFVVQRSHGRLAGTDPVPFTLEATGTPGELRVAAEAVTLPGALFDAARGCLLGLGVPAPSGGAVLRLP